MCVKYYQIIKNKNNMKFKKGDIIKTSDDCYAKVLTIYDGIYFLSDFWHDEIPKEEIERRSMRTSIGYHTDSTLEDYTLFERPKEKWVPTEGEAYYFPSLSSDDFCSCSLWSNHDLDRRNLERGIVFKTKEEAVTCAKEMLGIKE